MLRKIFIGVFTLFSLLSVYVFSSMAQALSQTGSSFCVDFGLFEIKNPIAMLSFLILTIIVGGFNLVFSGDETRKVNILQESELESTERHTQNINESISNQYQEKVDLILNKVKEEINLSSKNSEKTEKVLWLICKELNLSQGLVYTKNLNNEEFSIVSSYAYFGEIEMVKNIELGIGLNGQVIKNKEFVLLKEVPKGYMKIVSGLGEISPDFLILIPVERNGKIYLFLELAGLGSVSTEEVKTIVNISESAFQLIH